MVLHILVSSAYSAISVIQGANKVSSPATLHPIPHIEDLLDRLGEARYFSTLDAKSGYHQMPLKPEDSEATAFIVPWGQYEWADRTPFGLKGAGYSFQRMMSAILGECNFVEALCYLDDILVWGRTWDEHITRLNKVLTKMPKDKKPLDWHYHCRSVCLVHVRSSTWDV